MWRLWCFDAEYFARMKRAKGSSSLSRLLARLKPCPDKSEERRLSAVEPCVSDDKLNVKEKPL